MSTILQPTPAPPAREPVLRPVLSEKWALTLPHLLLTTLLGGLLVMLSFFPLRGTDLWGHVLYGRWILEHGALPTTDPVMPLAEGMRVVDTAWLSQVILADVEQLGGAVWLSNVFALTVWLTFVVMARVFYLQSGRIGLASVGVLMMLVIGWSRIATIRPENFALLCFATLLWMLVGSRYRPAGQFAGDPFDRDTCSWRLGLGISALFALWANLHGSFLCGLALLACFAAGRIWDVACRERSLRGVVADRGVQRWIWMAECAALATLLNPYGIDLWFEVLGFAGKPAVRDVVEWAPLVLTGTGGTGFIVAMVLMLFVLRLGHARLEAWQVLALATFAAASCFQVRMLGWFAPIVAVVLVPQLAELLDRWFPKAAPMADAELPAGTLPPGRSWHYSLACVGVAWACFALSGLSTPVLGGTPRSDESLHGKAAPLALTAWLKEHPVEGLSFAPQWWADWLVWELPEGFEPFVSMNVHLVPRSVWQDYQRISMAEPGWDAALDRYNVQTIIVDRKAQPFLAQVMRRRPGWEMRYEDEQSQVYTRARKATKPETNS